MTSVAKSLMESVSHAKIEFTSAKHHEHVRPMFKVCAEYVHAVVFRQNWMQTLTSNLLSVYRMFSFQYTLFTTKVIYKNYYTIFMIEFFNHLCRGYLESKSHQ